MAGADELESLSAVFDEATATLETYDENGFGLEGGYQEPVNVDGVYQISNAGQLYWFAEKVNSGETAINGKLTANITVNENVLVNGELNSNKVSSFRTWTPIGNADNRYSGTFDGGNYKVSGLYLDTDNDEVGLFGWVDGSGKIQNVGVVDSYLKGRDDVGGVCGVNRGTLQNCYNTGSVTASGEIADVGGVCGYNESGGTIQNCYFDVTKNLNGIGAGSDGEATATGKTDFTTGEVAWLLNQGNGDKRWGQNLTTDPKDPAPVLDGPEVFKIGENEYSNTNSNTNLGEVNYYNAAEKTFKTAEEYTVLTTENGTVLNGGWYVVKDTVTFTDRLTVNGEVHLILTDGCTLDAQKGITVEDNNSLTIYSQHDDTAETGADQNSGTLVATVPEKVDQDDIAYGAAAIGSTADGYEAGSGWQKLHTTGAITIHGGVVTATAEKPSGVITRTSYGAGVGGGAGCAGGATTIYGGTVTAYSRIRGAGIGGGENGDGGTIAIHGGKIDAGSANAETNETTFGAGIGGGKNGSGGEITITGGKVEAICRAMGAGIGGGDGGEGGKITISGGVVAATGKVGGTGIGGGTNGSGGEITISNSNVTASGREGCAGIGGGDRGDGGTITITDSTVQASGGGAGIGGGTGGSGGTITITGSEVHATPGQGSAAIGGGGSTDSDSVGGSSGTIKIKDAYIWIDGNKESAGIGSGSRCNNNENSLIVIGGNTEIRTVGGDGAAAIGGGYMSHGGTILISGGKITAISSGYNVGYTTPRGSCIGNGYGYNGPGATVWITGGTLNTEIDYVRAQNVCEEIDSKSVGVWPEIENKIFVEDPYEEEASYIEIDATYSTTNYEVHGDAVLPFEHTITEGQTWRILKDATLDVSQNALTNQGTILYSCAKQQSEAITGDKLTGNGKIENPHDFDDNGFCRNVGINVGGHYQPAEETTDKDGKQYYAISNAGQLYWFAEQVNSGNTRINGKLTKDITVNKDVLETVNSNGDVSSFRPWTPIGNNDNRYSGTFDGGDHKVSGLYYNDTKTDYVGLFGYVQAANAEQVSIQNVGVVDSYLKGEYYVGGVCGRNDSGTIQNCYNTGTVAGKDYVGGVCGWNTSGGTIQNCYNTGSVTASDDRAYVGGVCGYNYGTIQNCYNTGSVTASGADADVGGVCGKNYGIIQNCYNTGSVTASGRGASVGGVCGYNGTNGGTNGTIQNCYFDVTKNSNGVGYGNGDVAGKNDFTTGEVAWLLNQGNKNPDWRQNLTEPNKDPSPVLNGPRVYKNGDTYTNTDPGEVNYYAQGEEHTRNGDEYTLLTAEHDTTLNSGWYVVNGTVTFAQRLTVNGDVHLILKDGCDLQANLGITVNSGNNLTIYSQQDECGGPVEGSGKLTVPQYVEELKPNQYREMTHNAGIGGANGNCGTITIHGGNITAYGGMYAAGIGGGSGGSGGTITIHGGKVRAKGGGFGAGIGGGDHGSGSTIWITGGEITALGSDGAENIGNGHGGSGASGLRPVWNTEENKYSTTEYEVFGDTATMPTDLTVREGTTWYIMGKIAEITSNSHTLTNNGTIETICNDVNLNVYKGGSGQVNVSHSPFYEYQESDNGFCPNCGAYQPAEEKTDETGKEYYAISNAGQLYWFAQQVNSGNTGINGKLTKDITVNKNVLDANGELNSAKVSSFRSWTPIGNSGNKYSGTFDGGNYKVSGLYLDTDTDYVGLFGYVYAADEEQAKQVRIQKVGVVDSYLKGGDWVGGVCGKNYGTIQNCYNTGSVTASGDDASVGGVCGTNYSTIQNCYFDATKNTNGVGSGGTSGVTGKTDFSTGEVAWLLNQNNEHPDWRQNLTEPNKDPSPVLNGPEVFKIGEDEYSNTKASYTVTIPANATVGGEGVEVKASEVKLGDAQTLQVTIDSGLNENGALIMHKDTAEIAATMKIGDEENKKPNPVVLTATNG